MEGSLRSTQMNPDGLLQPGSSVPRKLESAQASPGRKEQQWPAAQFSCLLSCHPSWPVSYPTVRSQILPPSFLLHPFLTFHSDGNCPAQVPAWPQAAAVILSLTCSPTDLSPLPHLGYLAKALLCSKPPDGPCHHQYKPENRLQTPHTGSWNAKNLISENESPFFTMT